MRLTQVREGYVNQQRLSMAKKLLDITDDDARNKVEVKGRLKEAWRELRSV